jgi:hypothetical protein
MLADLPSYLPQYGRQAFNSLTAAGSPMIHTLQKTTAGNQSNDVRKSRLASKPALLEVK